MGRRIVVTGSADGLGRAAAESLLAGGHHVVVHARNTERAASLAPLVARGAQIVVGDFADPDAVRRVAAEVDQAGPIDAVIHNAGVWSGPAVMPVNVIAPYLLTALVTGPSRLVYLSSGSHFSGRPTLAGEVSDTGRAVRSRGERRTERSRRDQRRQRWRVT